MPLSSNAVTILTYFLTIVVKLKHLFLIFGCIVKAHYYETSQLSEIKLKSGKVKILSGMKQKLIYMILQFYLINVIYSVGLKHGIYLTICTQFTGEGYLYEFNNFGNLCLMLV
jgi:hypothetical protein